MASQIDVILVDLDRYIASEVIALALNVDANLRSNPPTGTPVDTGWASANWVPAIGTPFVDATVDQVKDPTPAQVSAREQIAQQGLNDVLSWRNTDGPIFVSNNVPYIGALNNGWSGQSPAGFIQAAIELAIRQTKARVYTQTQRNVRAARARSSKPRPSR